MENKIEAENVAEQGISSHREKLLVRQSCAVCAWATWERTPTGRIRKQLPGRCDAPIPKPNMPDCVVVTTQKVAIWAKMGEQCPTFKSLPNSQAQAREALPDATCSDGKTSDKP